MELFSWLIIGHFTGDFLFQNNWMARNKPKLLALFVHSCVYTVSVSIAAFPMGGLRWYAILTVFVSHILLDQRAFVKWWCTYITKSADTPWLVIVADQAWHLIFLAVTCILNRL